MNDYVASVWERELGRLRELMDEHERRGPSQTVLGSDLAYALRSRDISAQIAVARAALRSASEMAA
jgi:hypothetical protein